MILNKNMIIPELSCITLCLTQDCNLRCKYCCVNHQPKTMSLDVALKSVDLLCSSNKTVHDDGIKNIIFFGGEPTLCFNSLIKPVVEYCTAKHTEFKFNYSITTNATLLSDEVIQFFKDNNFNVLLSIDGNKIAQDTNRVYKNSTLGSFDTVIQNVKNIMSVIDCPVRGTFTAETCKYLFDSIKFLNSLGATGVSIVPDVLGEWSNDDIDTLEIEIRKYTIDFLNSIGRNEIPLNFSSMAFMFEILLSHQTCRTRNDSFFCGLGRDNPTILWDGILVTCDYASDNDYDNIYTLGNIYEGIDSIKRDNLIELYKNNVPVCEIPEFCNDCPCKTHCIKKTCHYFSTMKYGNLSTKAYIQCKFERLLYEAATYIISIVGEQKLKELFKI